MQKFFPVILNLFQDLTSEQRDIKVNRLFYARFYIGEMLKRVTHDKLVCVVRPQTGLK